MAPAQCAARTSSRRNEAEKKTSTDSPQNDIVALSKSHVPDDLIYSRSSTAGRRKICPHTPSHICHMRQTTGARLTNADCGASFIHSFFRQSHFLACPFRNVSLRAHLCARSTAVSIFEPASRDEVFAFTIALVALHSFMSAAIALFYSGVVQATSMPRRSLPTVLSFIFSAVSLFNSEPSSPLLRKEDHFRSIHSSGCCILSVRSIMDRQSSCARSTSLHKPCMSLCSFLSQSAHT